MTSQLVQLSRAITKTVDALPLAGKYAVRLLTEELFNSRSGEEARYNLTLLSLLLVGLNSAHSWQARIGGVELMKDAARLSSDPSLLRLAETALDGAYVLLNAGVITANTILLCRIWQRGLTKGFVSSNPCRERRTLGNQDSRKVMLATCLLTLAGQLGYGSTINTAKNENTEQNKPKPTAVKPLTEE